MPTDGISRKYGTLWGQTFPGINYAFHVESSFLFDGSFEAVLAIVKSLLTAVPFTVASPCKY